VRARGTPSVPRSRCGLAALGLVSIGLVTTANRSASLLAPRWTWLPDSCVLSFLACCGMYLAIRPERPFARPVPGTDWARVRRITLLWLGLWLTASVIAGLVAGHWMRYRLSHGSAQLIGFLVLGPAQEELLFRGAIYELAERSRLGAGVWPPIIASSVLFSLHHLQLHGYHLTLQALLQMGFTLPMGVVFGLLRAESRSLWPGLGAHVLTNMPGAAGS
jgi:membrane protease YdiL (CAAX protease family)